MGGSYHGLEKAYNRFCMSPYLLHILSVSIDTNLLDFAMLTILCFGLSIFSDPGHNPIVARFSETR